MGNDVLIKKQALQARALSFINSDQSPSTVEMATGTGKSWVMGGLIKERRHDRRQMVVVPTELLRDVNMVEEFRLQGIDLEDGIIELLCYASIDKLLKNERTISGILSQYPVDLYLDESHCITPRSAEIIKKAQTKGLIASITAFSATIEDDKFEILETLGFTETRRFKYTIAQAIKEGLASLEDGINIHYVDMSSEKNVKIEYTPKKGTAKAVASKVKSSFMTSESASYSYIEDQYSRCRAELFALNSAYWRHTGNNFRLFGDDAIIGMDSQFVKRVQTEKAKLNRLRRNRMLAIYKSPSKLREAMAVIERLRSEGKKFIIFHQDTETLDQLTPNAVHSNKPNSKELVNQFNDGLIREIGGAKMLDMGLSLRGIQAVVIVQLSSKGHALVQRLGRGVGRADNCEVHIFVLRRTQDEDWLESAIVQLGDAESLVNKLNYAKEDD